MLDPDLISSALERHLPRALPQAGLRPAAVLLPIYRRQGRDTVLLTRRSDRLNHHRGEISFPGGARNADDVDLRATALRETEEEMGIRAGDVSVLGRLDDFVSVAGYHVTPFVGTFRYPYPFVVNREEIAEVLEVDLEQLRDPAVFRKENWSHRGRQFPVCFYTVDGNEIWGLTAAILRQFLKRVSLRGQVA
ncbi:coenzyme A pyrophosphatase [Desulfuromonas versatilis]|uniref:Coenzyme A pyrophosphatase n=1 Tax=Desulfuromonas versatilis TaxID=2802975 RepID=A0ABM8HP46_9BACT|nr:CoA pyrophosphatase [Desulfuromonas versatilis]BCR03360.1 coenzyme A pyrophosphatase [Desulfuromonas versatilis]